MVCFDLAFYFPSSEGSQFESAGMYVISSTETTMAIQNGIMAGAFLIALVIWMFAYAKKKKK